MIYYVILILLVVVLVFWIAKLLQEKRESEKEVVLVEREKDDFEKLGSGLVEYNLKLQEKKQEAKNKILEMFSVKQGKGEQVKLSSIEVCKSLGISSSSTARYCDDLEKEGNVKQVGRFGKTVYYQKIG